MPETRGMLAFKVKDPLVAEQEPAGGGPLELTATTALCEAVPPLPVQVNV
jgi:hypothetical protein